jgi:hypothetical protein
MMGFDKPSAEMGAANERRAQYYLSQILRQHLAAYELVMAKGDPNGWTFSLLKLRRLVDTLEEGKWPAGEDGLNWFWSLPWGSGLRAERDCWVFWAKEQPNGGGSGDGAEIVEIGPKDGAKRKLVGSAA